jgi:hypothetical protein
MKTEDGRKYVRIGPYRTAAGTSVPAHVRSTPRPKRRRRGRKGMVAG